MTGDPFTGGNHEEWDKENTLEIGGTVIQSVHDVALEALGIDKQAHEKAVSRRLKEEGFIPDIAGRDIRTPVSDPDSELD